MVFKNLCVLVLWTKVASALKGLIRIEAPSVSGIGAETARSERMLIRGYRDSLQTDNQFLKALNY